MKKFLLVTLLVLILCMSATAAFAAVICTHPTTVVGERVEYEDRGDGHMRIVTQTLYCQVCKAEGISVINDFVGHDFRCTGHYHPANSTVHTSYYLCTACGHPSTQAYFCLGSPCAIALGLEDEHVLE